VQPLENVCVCFGCDADTWLEGKLRVWMKSETIPMEKSMARNAE